MIRVKECHGFTLIELMIVVAVIGILSAIAIPKFADLVRKSNEASLKGVLGSLRSALSFYYCENEGMYPEGGTTYVANITFLQDSLVPKYIKEWPECYVQPYHSKTDTVDYYPSHAVWDSSCDGEWVYDGNRTDQYYGHITIECWHTDSKGDEIISW